MEVNMTNISKKQLKANQANAKLGGVKTEAGKQKSKYNAVKHNMLTKLLSDKEAKEAQSIKIKLHQQFEPANTLEEILVERIAIWSVRLQRVLIAETEQIKSMEDPRITETTGGLELHTFGEETRVIKEGYTPKVKIEDIEVLAGTYFRYETAIEARLYKTLHELQRLQLERKGQKVPPALSVDVDIEGGKNGFVS